MAKSEDEALKELLEGDGGQTWRRLLSTLWSGLTLVVVVALMFVTMRQIAQAQQDAFEAHQRETEVQQALDRARLVQAIGSEQFLSFGSSSFQRNPCATSPQSDGEAETGPSARCLRDVDRAIDDLLQGRFVEISQIRTLRTFLQAPDGPASKRDLADALLKLNSLERWAAPLAADRDEVTEHQLYRTVRGLVQRGQQRHSDPRWTLAQVRLDGVVLGVTGAGADVCDVCADLLWTPASDDTERTRRALRPSDSLEAFVWQAECLRKLPTLSDASFIDTCGGDGTASGRVSARSAARQQGAKDAEQLFRDAAAWLEHQAPDGDRAVLRCGVLADSGEGAGIRTMATTASRAYNGLGMTLLNREGVDDARLSDAQLAIEKAVCLREAAQQTPAQVAASRENLAVIAYRTAYLAHEEGRTSDARTALGHARCFAEASVHHNRNLPWSWTLLHLTQGIGTDEDCTAVLGSPTAFRSRSRSEVWRQLTFFEPQSFAPDELQGLLPLLRDRSLNKTGYEGLQPMLEDLAVAHEALVTGGSDPFGDLTGVGDVVSGWFGGS
ncbi:MAG: hypothetical protein KTR31_16085 [Myxococcales bacterium]|nr:hypothetical protein [Myxococcales bacterium]